MFFRLHARKIYRKRDPNCYRQYPERAPDRKDGGGCQKTNNSEQQGDDEQDDDEKTTMNKIIEKN